MAAGTRHRNDTGLLLADYDDKQADFEETGLSDKMMKNLLLEQSASSMKEERSLGKSVVPKAGFCLKTKTEKNEKIFINICTSSEVPSPKDITDEQLVAIMESGDAVNYRVPLSLGEPHSETDKAGKDCTVYDVIISDHFFDVVQERSTMKDFLLTVVLEGIEDKYSLRLCRECRILKNRNYFGSVPVEQRVREKPKPFIIEMDNENDISSEKQTKNHVPEPEYTIIREPVVGDIPEYLVLEVHLPKVLYSNNIMLDVGEDCIILSVRPELYYLNIDLPFTVEAEEAGAQFDRESHILSVTLMVTGKAMY